jgi:PAS domain S-box-containing protein
LIPFVALGLQWLLWDYISPFVWFLFFPAVFFSARLGRFVGGLSSTLISALIVIYFFMSPQLSWEVSNSYNLFSVGMFVVMGYLFSDIQNRFWKANQRTEAALQETREAHKEISALYEKTLELDELKTQFFANVSHELRTPLTLVLGPLRKTLTVGQLAPEVRQDLEVAERNARFLHRHVDDLLDISKLDAGHMAIHYSQVDLARLARMIASQFNVVASERGVTYILDIPPSVAAQVDAEKCRRILLNLLSNAFKFSPDNGMVGVSLQTEEDFAIFQVWDSGPGIPEDKREVVFERFRQLDGSANRKHGGTGLGLSIVREFVELHNGEVNVRQAMEGGALFIIRLPLMAPANAVVDPAEAELNDSAGRQLVDELVMERQATVKVSAPKQHETALILVVEDNADMANFIIMVLSQHYRVIHAADGQAGLNAAIDEKPDLILADVMMPIMSGDEMVRAIRQRDELKDVPIVMLTAKKDETLQLQMLQEGAQDYIHKPFTVGELRARVENLLAARREALEKLQASELQYRTLFANMVDGIAYCKMIFEDGRPVDWVYLAVNPAFEALTGLKNAAGQRVTELIPGIRETDPSLFDLYARVAVTREPEKFEIHLESLNMWFSVSVYSPEPGNFVAVFEVVTERKEAEKRLHIINSKLETLINVSPLAIFMLDKDNKVEIWNPSAERMFGWKAEDVIGLPNPLVPPALKSEYETLSQQVMQGKPLNGVETVRQRKDGTLVDVSISSAPLYDGAKKLVGRMAIIADITERKQAEETLRKNALQYSAILETAMDGFWLVDVASQRVLEINEAYCKMSGYTREEILQMTVSQLEAVESPEDIAVHMQRVQEFGGDRFESAHRRKDGSIYPLEISVQYLSEVGRTFAFMHDISQRKEAEMALHKRENGLREAQRLSHSGNWEWQIATDTVQWSDELYRINGRDPSRPAPCFAELASCYTPESWERLRAAVENSMQSGEPYELDLDIVRVDGEIRRTFSRGEADYDASGRLIGFHGTVQDITERKMVEAELAKSNERFELAQESAGVGVWDWNVVSGQIEWTSKMFELFGLDVEQDVASFDSWRRALHPEDRDGAEKQITQALNDHVKLNNEYRIIWPDGRIRWINAAGRGIYDEDDRPLRMIGICTDVTERRQAEEALRENEEKLRTVFNTMEEGMALNELIFNEQGNAVDYRILEINPAYEMVARISREQAVGRTASEIYFMKAEEVTAFWNMHRHNEHAIKTDLYFPQTNTWQHVSTSKITNNRFVTLFFDVTEQKNAELSLQESEKRFSSAFEFAPIGMALVAPDGRWLKVNRAVCEFLGYTEEELLATDFQAITHPDDLGPDLEYVRYMLDGELTTYKMEKRYFHKSGEIVWALLSVSLVRNEKEEPQYFISQIVNITDSKRAEIALRESEERLKFAQQVAHVGHWSWDTVTNRVTWSDEMKRIFGLDPATFEGDLASIIENAIHPEDREKVDASNNSVLTVQKPIPLEYRIIRPDGSIRTVWGEAGEKIFDTRGKIIRLSGIVQDITERRQADETLRESEERWLFALEGAGDGVWDWDAQTNEVYYSRQWKAMLGYEVDEIDRRFDEWINRIHPQDRDYVLSEINKHLTGQTPTYVSEHRLQCKDGTYKWILDRGKVMHRTADGKPLRVIGTHTDITARKQIEDALKQSEARLLEAQRISRLGDWSWDARSDAVIWSKELYALARLDENVPAPNYAEHPRFYTVDSMRRLDEAVQSAIHSGQPYELDLEMIRTDGSIIWVSARGEAVYDDANQLIGLRGTVFDVTERRQAEQRIEKQLRRMGALHEIAKAINSSVDLNFTLEMFLNEVMGQLSVDAASVLLFNKSSLLLEYTAGRGFHSKAMQHTKLQPGEGYAGRIILDGKPIHIPDLRKTEGALTEALTAAGESFTAYIGTPLVVKGLNVGVLEIFNRKPLDADADWIHYIELLADQAAIAIDNARMFENLQRSNLDLTIAYDAAIEGWSHAMDLRDKETEGHTQRVAKLTMDLAQQMNLPESQWIHIRRGALLHDIGKLGVPDSILFKPGPLTEKEWATMRQHPVYANDMLSSVAYLKPAIDIPYCHHELWDGSGYPRGLKGEEIPLAARIFTVVDVWDALRSNRPYREAWSAAKVRAHIRENAGIRFDPRVADEFLKLVENE